MENNKYVFPKDEQFPDKSKQTFEIISKGQINTNLLDFTTTKSDYYYVVKDNNDKN